MGVREREGYIIREIEGGESVEKRREKDIGKRERDRC